MMRDEIDHADPIPRPVLDEVCQLLGYDSREVVSIRLEAQRITVITREPVLAPGSAERLEVMHLHVVV